MRRCGVVEGSWGKVQVITHARSTCPPAIAIDSDSTHLKPRYQGAMGSVGWPASRRRRLSATSRGL